MVALAKMDPRSEGAEGAIAPSWQNFGYEGDGS
jgi:hypothetical protein